MMCDQATSLRAQQQALAAAIVGDTGHIEPWLQPRADGTPALIQVYRHAHAARLRGALRDNFEVLARAMGDEGFDALAGAYLAAHPSTRPSIRWWGDRLAEFMAQAGDDLVPHPALVDLARMDWALRSAFDAADAPMLQPTDLQALPPEAWPALRLQLHPSVALVPLQWAVEAAWRTLQQHSQAAEERAEEPELPPPQALEHTLLVWRRGLATQWRSLDESEATLLRAVQAGEPFAALGEIAATGANVSDDPQAAGARMASALNQWLADGLLAGFAA